MRDPPFFNMTERVGTEIAEGWDAGSFGEVVAGSLLALPVGVVIDVILFPIELILWPFGVHSLDEDDN